MTTTPPHRALILATPLLAGLRLGVALGTQGITQVEFICADVPLRQEASGFAGVLQRELAEYFLNPAVQFHTPLTPGGTPFQRRVWERLRLIPAGTVLSYGELARELASGARAVAAACRANPIPLLIPCHRVVASDGVGGYMGATEGQAVMIKQWLLHHEGALP